MALISSRHDKDDWIVTLEAKHNLLPSLLKNSSTGKGLQVSRFFDRFNDRPKHQYTCISH